MSFLTDASLVFIPSGYKEDKAYSIKPTDGSGDLTFARASDGTRVNSEGYVERVPWNLLQYSNAFSTSPWSAAASTLTSGQSGYDGSSNAWLITQTSAYGRLRYYLNITGTHTYSAYFKPGNTNWVCLFVNDGSIDKSAFFNLTGSGSIGDTNNLTSASIESVGNGWYRCSIVANYTAGDEIRVYPSIQNDFSTSDKSVYIQDAQLNEGTLKPYFPTTNRQDVPRLDYSNGCPCLLLEPQRTNLALYSEQFDNSAWGLIRANLGDNTISPSGLNNGYSIIANTTNDDHFIGQNITVTNTITYSFSAFLKKGNKNWARLWNTSVGYVDFDLQNGVVGTQSSATGSIESVGNGWYRCSIVYTATSTSTNAHRIYPLAGDNSRTFAGDGSTINLYFWGAQLEAGSYPTSYIPTTSASVTRVADAASKTGISDLIGQSEGTMFYDFIYKTTDQTRVSISDGSSTNWIFIGIPDSSTHSRLYIRTNGTVQVDTSSNLLGIFTSGQRYKIALAYKSGDWAIAVNGTIKTSGSQTFSPSAAFNTIVLTGNSSAASSQLGLNQMNQALLFKTRLTNDQLEYLTGNSYSTYATMASQLNYTIQ